MDKEALSEKTESEADDSTWAHDQKQRDYYYDDSHGYEIYDPDQDEDENDEELSITKSSE